ncbi:toll/interleukin-1 receptor domain-containing protein [Lysobacter claricitrinus]|uniref:toll/interleukin-1 receptor domain-containing protein n=1 Tax=Lysobacter claricitrinus TaxID=3367728 RepID=UPI0037DBB6A6
MKRPVRALISYSHKDENHRLALVNALATATRANEIEIWSDHRIAPGKHIDDAILAQLKDADVVLLLVSHDFIASDYCYKTELQTALERHDNGRCVVIPIVVRPTDLEGVPFERIKRLPYDGRPITSWINEDEGWLSVARGVREAIRDLPGVEAPSISRPKKLTERLAANFDTLQTRYVNQVRPNIGFGLAELDEMTDGIWRGEVALVASRPEHGHIDLGCAATIHTALTGKEKVLVLSQHMAANQYTNRLLCAVGLISRPRLLRGGAGG